MKQILKIAILVIAKYTGLFALSRRITSSGVRILCYHGISMDDEHKCDPKLFISRKVFQRRISYIERKSFCVIPLAAAVEKSAWDNIPRNAVVITFDDGFVGAVQYGGQLLKQKQFPATFYICTQSVLRSQPIPELLLKYILWRASISEDCPPYIFFDGQKFNLSDKTSATELFSYFLNMAIPQTISKLDLVLSICRKLNLDCNFFLKNRIMCLLNPDEIMSIYDCECDIQLHTHNHVFPEEKRGQKEEVLLNRQHLESLTKMRTFFHFCYPSNIKHSNSPGLLKALSIKSATTCDSYFNWPDSDPMLLGRFLDSESVAQIEFEAEMCGFREVLRLVADGVFKLAGRAIRTKIAPNPKAF